MTKKLPALTSKNGFTLIELLVVVSLTVLLMMTAVAVFMSFLISNSKLAALNLVKSEGDYALSQLEFFIRNSIALETTAEIEDPCEEAMSAIAVRSMDGGVSVFSLEPDPGDDNMVKIASSSATQTLFLTSSAVEVGELRFDCTQPDHGGSARVGITLSIDRATDSLDEREMASQVFQTTTTIRSN